MLRDDEVGVEELMVEPRRIGRHDTECPAELGDEAVRPRQDGDRRLPRRVARGEAQSAFGGSPATRATDEDTPFTTGSKRRRPGPRCA